MANIKPNLPVRRSLSLRATSSTKPATTPGIPHAASWSQRPLSYQLKTDSTKPADDSLKSPRSVRASLAAPGSTSRPVTSATNGLADGSLRTGTKKPKQLTISQDTVQRLAVGGIPHTSPRMRRRSLCTTSDVTAIPSGERCEPKSILKHSPRRRSMSYGEIAASSSVFKQSLMSAHYPDDEGQTNHVVSPSDRDFQPSEELILKNCNYRLSPLSLPSEKKVTFIDDVVNITN
ncbi:uncharacterized protein LOC131947511 [Physella acuta]|uniref:uncharacterized protein LOC131947511 n=1 Tax=Physella acuta TaxID=109671 RepID=UPI0027DB7941|nr:uncharacterized protein LOC131947511 [Physella acuta]